MPDLYIVAAQPNPPGRDTTYGHAANEQLNREWVEFEALRERDLIQDSLYHATFNDRCQQTGSDELVQFGSLKLRVGQRVRVHTGQGADFWDGNTFHYHLNRGWYVWNNSCGDRATLSYQGSVIDGAFYRPNPPEGILVRLQGTNEMIPTRQASYSGR